MIRLNAVHQQRQTGAALLILLALLGIIAVVLVSSVASSALNTTERDRKTALALAKAREALIARAVLDPNNPGSLPCPDLITNNPPFNNIPNDGIADSFSGIDCPSYVGRLPWRTLGLPDLRDGYGERLWYALSPSFRDNRPVAPINSDTLGVLTVTGNTPMSGAIAIVFSPGAALGTQVRDSANENNVAMYLDGENANGDTTYTALDPSSTFNDRLLVITNDMLLPAVESRIAREARACLNAFSQQPGANNRFPWAAPLTDVSGFADVVGTTQGRIPKTLLSTNTSLAPATVSWISPSPALSQPCFGAGTWWDNWREFLFYHVSQAYEPSTAPTGSCPADCVTVNGAASIKAIVIVSGHAFIANPAQLRDPVGKTVAANYLELDPTSGINNSTMSGSYAKAPQVLSPTAHFNDRLECLQQGGSWPC